MNTYKGAHRGRFIPENAHKWVDPNNITYRSGIEQRYFVLFDRKPNVIKVASEKIIVPYYDLVTRKYRKYYVDLMVKFKAKSGIIRTHLIEIKSSSESVSPKKQKRITEAYRNKVCTYVTNKSKWQAATKYAEKRGWDFFVLTEKDLHRLKR